jgi:hypothetical protein
MLVVGTLNARLRSSFLPATHGRWSVWITILGDTNGLLRDLPNDTAGIACGKHALWNVPCNYTPGTNHRM